MFNFIRPQSPAPVTYRDDSQIPSYDKQVMVYPQVPNPYRSFKEPDPIINVMLTTDETLQDIGDFVKADNQQSKNLECFNNEEDKKKDVVDTSTFSVEERLISAVWVHERARTRLSIGQIKRDFKMRFNKKSPTKNTLLMWERKLFSTGCIMDAKRSGRPCQRQEHIAAVRASVATSPSLSLRARASALSLPRTTLRKILCDDLKVDKQTKKAKNELSSTVKRKRIVKNAKAKIKQKPKTKMSLQAAAQSKQNVERYDSHPQYASHQQSTTHLQPTSHPQPASHQQPASHPQPASHQQLASHPQAHVNYRGYTDFVVPVNQFPPYSYQSTEMKPVHHVSMVPVPHQHYVVSNVHSQVP